MASPVHLAYARWLIYPESLSECLHVRSDPAPGIPAHQCPRRSQPPAPVPAPAPGDAGQTRSARESGAAHRNPSGSADGHRPDSTSAAIPTDDRNALQPPRSGARSSRHRTRTAHAHAAPPRLPEAPHPTPPRECQVVTARRRGCRDPSRLH